MATVVLLDDHDIVRYGLEAVLRSAGHDVVASEASLTAGLLAIGSLRPDIVLTDMTLGDSQGLDTVRRVVQAQLPRPVIVVSMHDEILYAERVLALGAMGYVMKETAHASISSAVLSALGGQAWVSPRLGAVLARKLARGGTATAAPAGAPASFTDRELDVLEALKAGRTTKEIATALHLSVRTVDFHRANIKQKLALRTGAELIAFASRL